MINSCAPRAIKGALAIVVTIILLRLLSLPFPDLIDTTEGRYASVAKLMFDRNDWLTPWIYFQGEVKPYQGKPPLHFWLMQICYLVFGVNAWSARLPSLLSALLIGGLLYVFVNQKLSTHSALASVCIFGTSALLFFLAGACVLDVTLTLGISLALVGFALGDQSRIWATLFFVGLGLGVLVKGPLAIALPVLTIAPWAVLRRWSTGTWPMQLMALRWIHGISAFTLVVAPWYLIQEFYHPGFLRYFIWNENLARYLVKDYGDAYGTGHQQPFGASWLMLFIGLTPWSFIALPTLLCFRWRRGSRETARYFIEHNPWVLYGLLWMVSSPLLFTFARQYTATYFVPSIPGFALLMASGWHTLANKTAWGSTSSSTACRYTVGIFGLLGIIGGLCSLRFGGTPIGVVVACFFGLMLLTYAARRSRFSEMLPSVASVALSAGLIYGLVFVCYSEFISMKRSSRRALELAHKLIPSDKPLTIGFPFYFPFSATFYGATIAPRQMTTMLIIKDQIASAPLDAIIVRGGNDKQIQDAEPNRKILGKVGRWTIFEGNTGLSQR